MSAKALGDPQELRTRRLASRRQGVTIPEVAEFFDVKWAAAARYVSRLVAAGVLGLDSTPRRRVEVFGQGVRGGRACRVYRARVPVPTGPKPFSRQTGRRPGYRA